MGGVNDDAHVEHLFRAFDANKDGEVTKEEFIQQTTKVGHTIDFSGVGKVETDEPAAKRARTDDKGDFRVGDKVEIVNVATEAGKQFNGKIAEVIKWNEPYKRWLVRLPAPC